MTGGSLSAKSKEWLGRIPQIDRLLRHEKSEELLQKHPRIWVVRALQARVRRLRKRILSEQAQEAEISEEALLFGIEKEIFLEENGKLRRLINATGVVIHTNLGRAPLGQRALERVVQVAKGYCNLEYDVGKKARGGRMDGVEDWLCALTGAEAAYVVNNNAAAVMLGLSTMAAGQEVVISRGELVEIGGSFRVPDVMRAAGVHLYEVGTTNRTHAKDYRNAINENTGLLLKVHQSNYVIKGFTKEVELDELVQIGKEHGVPVMVDLGSGSLLSLPGSTDREPTVQQMMKSGLDLLTFSGDKLLGGPQAGIIVGKKEWVEKASKMPITRALRVDKLTMAALEATLQAYMEGAESAISQLPVLTSLTKDLAALKTIGEALICEVEGAKHFQFALEDSYAAVGGGALPEVQLPTLRLAISSTIHKGRTIESAFRSRAIPIIGLLEKGRFLLDLRSLLASEIDEVKVALREVIFELDQPVKREG